MQWLEQHLDSIDRCLTPWLVVSMHRPMYVVHPHKSNRVVAGTCDTYLLHLHSQSQAQNDFVAIMQFSSADSCHAR